MRRLRSVRRAWLAAARRLSVGVEEGHALGGLPQADQGLAAAEPTQRHQVRIAEAVAELGGLVEAGGGRGRIARGHAVQGDRDQQEPLFHAVAHAVAEQPAAPCQPAAAAGRLGPFQQQKASQNAHRAAPSTSPARRKPR
jgi:hypothetical protein